MTVTLRLFKASEPARQIDSRTLDSGELRVGRDAGQDWPIDDPGRLISRAHLVIAAEGDAVTVTDVSSNGVFLADGDKRLPQGRSTPVPLGSTLRFGPYLIVVERATAGRAAAAPSPPAPDPFASASPFAAAGERPARDPLRPVAPDPFASALPDDAFGFALGGERAAPARAPGAPTPPPSSNDDAWSRPRERRVGDWDAPSPRREGHENLIGSGQAWAAPPAAPPAEVGFGFDAPFSQPILKAVEISRQDLAIPSDWDEASGVPAWTRSPAPEAWPAQTPANAAPAAAPAAAIPPPSPPPPPPEPPLLAEAPPAAPVAEPRSPPPPQPAWDAPPRTAGEAWLREAAAEPAPAATAPSPPSPPPPTTPPSLALVPEPAPPVAPATRAPTAAASDTALLEAFCRGAKLDPANFSRLEPDEVMLRVGAIYRQMILGMSDLMGERTSLKNEYRMVRTTVRADNNNPFKWLPPQTVATQLLLKPEEGFIGGPEAVSGAFRDLKKHLLCLLAGLRAALGATLDALSPKKVEDELGGRSMMMKNRDAEAWREYAKLYADFRKEADDNPDSPINREFRAAYERQLTELDRVSPG